jgi:hypothetical protein
MEQARYGQEEQVFRVQQVMDIGNSELALVED